MYRGRLELPEVPGPGAFLVQAGAKDMPPEPETTLNGTNGTDRTKEAEHATRAENGKDQGAAENHPRLAITCYDEAIWDPVLLHHSCRNIISYCGSMGSKKIRIGSKPT